MSQNADYHMPPLAGLALVQERYDAILCDIWGVLHNGVISFPAAAEALVNLRKLGKSVALITNAPRPREEVATQLASLGVPREAYDAILTSGDVCAELVAERLPERPYHIGPARDLPLFDSAAALAGVPAHLAPLEKADFVVCTGLVDDATETPADYEAVLQKMREKNLSMICANPDLVVYRGDELIYCAGALAERYEALGGTVAQAGKPFAPIYRMALGRAEQALRRPLDLDKVLAIGDAMHTDIAGANAMGLDCVLITQGIHRADLHGPGEPSELDAEAFAQFLDEHGAKPLYRMDRLVW